MEEVTLSEEEERIEFASAALSEEQLLAQAARYKAAA